MGDNTLVECVNINIQQVEDFLAERLIAPFSGVEYVGAGAWSRCFGFRQGDEEFVIRFGNYVDDFQCDQQASAYATPDLPIPEVREIGQAFDGYYAISQRVRGIPLETVSTSQWQATIPSLVAALEAMRLADLSETAGVGGWIGEGRATFDKWSQHLLAVGDDTPDRRTYGWREKLAVSPSGDRLFEQGFALLQQVASDAVPRCLVHCDLINGNALVDETGISGIFDWGCALYGDHLYDLAWFEFWAPWSPQLNIQALRPALEQRWQVAGYTPENQEARLIACYLHIGLDHLAYNAHLEDWATLDATVARMRALVAALS